MACILSEDEKMQRMINKAIERKLKMDKKYFLKEVKLLLLGAGESGKTTFIKQMRIIHGAGYTDEDRRTFIHVIYQNIFMAMTTLIQAMGEMMMQFEQSQNQQHAVTIMQIDPSTLDTLDESIVMAIKTLWKDRGIQYCYRRRNELQLNDSAKHYLDEIDTIAEPGFTPTIHDILMARKPTTGIIEYTFSVDNVHLRMVDVGGQRSERRKWIHAFENVSAITFLTAVNEYDQTIAESTTMGVNRLEESKALYATLLTYDWFKKTNIILFLNKIDILKDKIQYSHLADFYPAFTGPPQDDEAARKFILNMFLDVSGPRVVYPHFTCATDTENIKFVFKSVQDTVLQTLLDDNGLE